MSNEKPVELTKAERAALMHHIGGWKFERQGLANAEDAFMAEVSRIVAAREAAARREALLEAAEESEMRINLANRVTSLEAKVARVEALAEEFRKSGFTSVYESAEEIAELIDRALAEPERDEEGGMLGGNPNFKHRDATVPMDGEQPGPRAKPRLRACVEAWPGCAEGEYNPACCRFPKSCSCDVYDPARVGPEDLEEGGR